MYNNNQPTNIVLANNLPQGAAPRYPIEPYGTQTNYQENLFYGNDFNKPSNPGDISFSELIKIISDRKTIIGIIVATFFALAILYCLITPNKYTAASTIEIGGYAPVLSSASAENLYGQDTRKQDYQRTTTAKLLHLSIVD